MGDSGHAATDDRSGGRVFASAKDPRFVESGRRGARRRWGEQRIARLDELRPEARRLVLALIAAAKSEETESPVAA